MNADNQDLDSLSEQVLAAVFQKPKVEWKRIVRGSPIPHRLTAAAAPGAAGVADFFSGRTLI